MIPFCGHARPFSRYVEYENNRLAISTYPHLINLRSRVCNHGASCLRSNLIPERYMGLIRLALGSSLTPGAAHAVEGTRTGWSTCRSCFEPHVAVNARRLESHKRHVWGHAASREV